jgi:hypothetical protein
MNYTITSQGPFEVHVVSGGGSGVPIAKISLEKCKWQKHLNQLTTPWNSSYPREITVHNHNTDTLRLYTQINDTDPRFDQDQWDGEQMVYKTHAPTNNAEYLVLYRGS